MESHRGKSKMYTTLLVRLCDHVDPLVLTLLFRHNYTFEYTSPYNLKGLGANCHKLKFSNPYIVAT